MPRAAASDPLLHILLALSDRPRHGYAIITEIEKRTEGLIRLGTGTVYSALKRLLSEGFIVEVSDSGDGSSSRGKRSYALSEAGRLHLEEQTERLRLLAAHAIGKNALPGYRKA